MIRGDESLAVPESWESVQTWLVIAALALSPLSYTVKIVYHLPFTWIDPTLILGATAALLPPWTWNASRLRMVAIFALLFLGVYWLSATVAIARARFPNAEEFREPVRTVLAFLLAVACVRSIRGAVSLRRIGTVMGWIAVLEIATAVYLLAGLALHLPMPAEWRTYEEAYWFRQALYSGAVVWPRLGGTFIEAPPFGLYVLGAIIVVHFARRSSERMPGRWMDFLLWLGLIGSLSTQVLIGAVLWGVFFAAARLIAAIGSRRTRWTYGLIALTLASLVALGAYRKYSEGKQTLLEQGASVGERRAHMIRSWRVFVEHPLVGVGPGQYGQIAMRESFSEYDPRVSPQFMGAELLVDSGALGLGAAALLIASLIVTFARRRDYDAIGAALALVVADGFQANWRWPAVFIAFGVLLAVSRDWAGADRGERRDVSAWKTQTVRVP